MKNGTDLYAKFSDLTDYKILKLNYSSQITLPNLRPALYLESVLFSY